MTDQAPELKPCPQKRLMDAVGTFYRKLARSEGRYPMERLALVDWHRLFKAYTACLENPIPDTLDYPVVKDASELVEGRWYFGNDGEGPHETLVSSSDPSLGVMFWDAKEGYLLSLDYFTKGVRGPIPMPEEK